MSLIPPFAERIALQIRETAARAVIYLYQFGDLAGDPRFRRIMASVVRAFEDPAHWQNLHAQALSHHADGQFDEAARMYEEAKQVVQRDPRFLEPAQRTDLLRYLDVLAADARRSKPLVAIHEAARTVVRQDNKP